jgi:hypothetical protein
LNKEFIHHCVWPVRSVDSGQEGIEVSGLVSGLVPASTFEWSWSAGGGTPPYTFRYAINQEKEWAFSSSDEFGTVLSAETDAGLEGVWYIHVQAMDSAGEVSGVETASAILDNTAPIVTGLENDDGPVTEKTWTWGAEDADSEIGYRFKISENADWNNPKGDYELIETASLTDVTGVWYIHVQARDRAGNESEIYSVYAIFDEPSGGVVVVTGLTNKFVPVKWFNWTWSAEGGVGPYLFRYAINQESEWAFAAGDEFGEELSASTEHGLEGEWYIHVQAKDSEETVSEVVSASVILDNTAPVILGLENDEGPVTEKTWTWSGEDADSAILYRYTISENPEWTNPAGEYELTRSTSLSGVSGTWYLHVQATDRARNESEIYSVYAKFGDSTEEKGDLTGDGGVGVEDAIVALQIISGKNTVVFVFSDVNSDGRIGLEEVIFALWKSAGLIP